jgi:predicted Rossmann-fold nucleotide-binding protein
MTDIKSTKEGEYQTGYMKRNNKLSDKEFAQATEAMNAQQKEARPGDAAIWGGGGNINMKSVMGGQFKSVNGESVGINPKAAGNLAGPRAASYLPDPDNLQVSKP